jgi:uncharacterized damage-inducible protein DinB
MDPLTEAFQHHNWATLKLIRHLQELPAAAQAATSAGVYGEVLATLSHLMAADGRYLDDLAGVPRQPRTEPDEAVALDVLADRVRDHTVRWRMTLARLDEIDVTLPARPDRPELPHATNLLIAQALHHGTDHRTQICTALAVNGFEAPDIDVWAYWMSRRAE